MRHKMRSTTSRSTEHIPGSESLVKKRPVIHAECSPVSLRRLRLTLVNRSGRFLEGTSKLQASSEDSSQQLGDSFSILRAFSVHHLKNTALCLTNTHISSCFFVFAGPQSSAALPQATKCTCPTQLQLSNSIQVVRARVG